MSDKFSIVRNTIERNSPDAQGLNKGWWESLPMTYKDWDQKDRTLSLNDFINLEKDFLEVNSCFFNKFNFDTFKNKKVLEIGCGSGVASCLFSKAGADVTAIDITEAAVKMTTENSKTQNTNFKVNRMDGEKLQFENENFDYVFSWGVLHHSNNPPLAFKELSRVLKSSGKGMVMVYNRNSLRYYLKGFYWLFIKGKFFKNYSMDSVQSFFTDGYYHKHYTKSELVCEFSKLNLNPLKVSIGHMSKKMIPLIPKKIDEFLKKKFGWFLILEFQKN